VSVALLSDGIAETEEKTEARNGSVGPSSMRNPMMAMSVSVNKLH